MGIEKKQDVHDRQVGRIKRIKNMIRLEVEILAHFERKIFHFEVEWTAIALEVLEGLKSYKPLEQPYRRNSTYCR
jgi:hypothetical protein